MLSYRYLATGGGVHMEVIVSFIVAVMAGVCADRHGKCINLFAACGGT